ncbi:MAG TPA: tetratricopeptide repeat protein [Terriglobales bacterium]|nr:tetratricopeptide repeat protein [Terriglobales bacterium]
MRRTLTLGLVVVSLAALVLAQGGALSQADIDRLLSNGVSPQRVSVLVEQQGVSFAPDANYLRGLELRSDTDKLIEAVRVAGAKFLKPRAESNLKTQKWTQAEQDYRALLDLAPNDASAHAGLGSALVQQGRADASLSEFGKALAAEPNNAVAHRGMGIAMTLRKDYPAALAELRKARDLDPNDAMTHAALGDVMLEQGEADGAVLEFNQALKLDPALQSPRVGLARAYEKKGDLPGAESSYRALLAQDPRNPAVNFGLGKVLEKKGSNQEALSFYRVAYTTEPTNTTYRDAYEKMVAITVNVNANLNVNVNQPPPKPTGTGLIHVYRTSRFVAGMAAWNISVDDHPVGKLGNGRHFTVKVPVGRHLLFSELGRNPISIDVQPDREYYVEVELISEFFSAYVALSLRDPSTGQREFSSTRPIEPNRIYDAEMVVEGAGGSSAVPDSGSGLKKSK